MELLSSVLGFLASVTLFIPGWRASQYLRVIHEVKQAARDAARAGARHDPGEALAIILEEQNSSWSRHDHYLLIAGFFLLCLSFLLALVAKLFGAP